MNNESPDQQPFDFFKSIKLGTFNKVSDYISSAIIFTLVAIFYWLVKTIIQFIIISSNSTPNHIAIVMTVLFSLFLLTLIVCCYFYKNIKTLKTKIIENENQNKPFSKYGCDWDHNIEPHCPKCKYTLHLIAAEHHTYVPTKEHLSCANCSTAIYLRNDDGQPMSLIQAKAQLRNLFNNM
jgi:hypothetical protein